MALILFKGSQNTHIGKNSNDFLIYQEIAFCLGIKAYNVLVRGDLYSPYMRSSFTTHVIHGVYVI